MSIKILNSRTEKLKTFIVNFELCLLCQSRTEEVLQDPLKIKRISVDQCYTSIVEILEVRCHAIPCNSLVDPLVNVTIISKQVFKKELKLPTYLLPVMNMPNTSDFLKINSAKWHGSCRLKYSKVKASQLESLSKEKADDIQNSTANGKENNIESGPRYSFRTASTTNNEKQLICILPKGKLKLRELPGSYTIVEAVPEINRKILKIPQVFAPLICSTTYTEAIQIESQWLNAVESATKLEAITTEKVHWSSFHANRNRSKILHPCTTVLLPLFHETVHTPSMMNHSLKIAIKTTSFLNPGQPTVIACDEPLFAIVKELQWAYPELYENLVPMLGGLHIEMTILRCIGQWLEGSEWDTALCGANIATKGVAESFLHGTHVTKCRYAHQVTAAVLHILKRKAFLNEGLPNTPEAFTAWNSRKITDEPTFHYWDQVLELQQCLLLFVRAIREQNFELYVSALEEVIPWFFVLGHFNYAKWAVIHLNDMKTLKEKFPTIYSEFVKGKK